MCVCVCVCDCVSILFVRCTPHYQLSIAQVTKWNHAVLQKTYTPYRRFIQLTKNLQLAENLSRTIKRVVPLKKDIHEIRILFFHSISGQLFWSELPRCPC